MKVGIITFHCSYNFGSAIQSYALQSAIESLGHEASIIDYRSADFDYYRIICPQHPRNTLRTLFKLKGMLDRRHSFHMFWERYLNLTPICYSYRNERALDNLSEEFDCFVCGSDQIWNLDCTHGIVEPFFLAFAGNKRRVAYAPSVGHSQFKSSNFDTKKVSLLLSKFDRLSVRESEGLKLYQPLVKNDIHVVVDPTLLLDKDFYSCMASKQVAPKGYAFVYLLRQCDELVQRARMIAAKDGKRIIYVSQKNLRIPNSINMFGIGPEEFVSLVANADEVLTNSFHATVFSILFEKDFLSFALDESGIRISDLLTSIGLEGRCVTDSSIPQVKPIDWEEVKARLGKMTESSWEYLKESLEER